MATYSHNGTKHETMVSAENIIPFKMVSKQSEKYKTRVSKK